jgi:hypothetical protein
MIAQKVWLVHQTQPYSIPCLLHLLYSQMFPAAMSLSVVANRLMTNEAQYLQTDKKYCEDGNRITPSKRSSQSLSNVTRKEHSIIIGFFTPVLGGNVAVFQTI